MKVQYRVEGLKELDKELGRLSVAFGKKVLMATVLKAMKPLLNAYKGNLRKHRFTGALWKSAGIKRSTTARQWSVTAQVGPRQELNEAVDLYNKKRPNNKPIGGLFYSYMMEHGTIHSKGTKALTKAYDANGFEVIGDIRKELAKELSKFAQ